MRIVVTGGRDYADSEFIDVALTELHIRSGIEELAHGAASGADYLCGLWARENAVPVKPYPANWGRYGNSAGPIRNGFMLDDFKPDAVVAFPGGRGTRGCMRAAEARSVPVFDLT
jgi:hypothetical protein